MKTFRFFLLTCLFFSSALAQQPMAEPDVTTLSVEDQAVVKGLRFRPADAAPSDTRTAVYIKGRIKVVNSSQRAVINGKLNVEVRMLFHSPDKEWTVLKCRVDFAIPGKGSSTLHLSFEERNKQIEDITGSRKTKVDDSVTVVRYAGVKIFESEPSKDSGLPAEWWLREGSLSAPPDPADPNAPAKIMDTSKGELKVLRTATERSLRAQVWKTYEQGVAALNARYLIAIDKAMKTSQSQGLLDEALALRTEKDTVTKNGRPAAEAVPENAPALVVLRSTYDSSLATLKTSRSQASLPLMQDYNQKAEQLIERLIKEGKLDEAKAARDSKDVPLIAED